MSTNPETTTRRRSHVAMLPRVAESDLAIDLLQELRLTVREIDRKLGDHLAIHGEQDRQATASRQGRTAIAGASGGLIGALVTLGLKHLGVG